jgi:galactokinase
MDGTVTIDLDDPSSPSRTDDSPAWGVSVAAIVQALRERGHEAGAVEAQVRSTVPLGSGLSSSAAFGVACALALSEAAGAPVTGTELALVAQRAEHLAGVPCGVMDQMASVHGRLGHALLLDCRTLTIEPIRLPSDIAVIVVHSGLPRRLADSEYARRREACAAAAARLHIAALRDASAVDVADDPFARHVVSENERVVEFARALRGDDRTELGALMNASHASLRDDFAVSTPELDTLVGALLDAGALGARLTGAGFGGSVVALAPHGRAATIARDAAERYRAATGLTPTAFVTTAVDGARSHDAG